MSLEGGLFSRWEGHNRGRVVSVNTRSPYLATRSEDVAGLRISERAPRSGPALISEYTLGELRSVTFLKLAPAA